MKYLFALLLLLGCSFASICANQSVQVCAADGQTYANESQSPSPVIYCGTCVQYQLYADSIDIYGTNQSQLNTSNRSYMERFMSASFRKIVGDDEFGDQLFAIIIGGFFFTFVSFQNIRIEGKAVVLIPAFILAAYFANWILALMALVLGVLMYLALSKIFNK